MNAMTWYDWKTHSVWSQPWGAAISGELKGASLTLIPGAVVPWSTWRDEHPDTTVVTNDLEYYSSLSLSRGALPFDNFVIGVALKEAASAYYFKMAAERRVINDFVGEYPIAVFVDPDTRDIRVYLRRASAEAAPPALEFELDADGNYVDRQTGSVWDVTRAVSIEGALKGAALQQVPYVTAFDWAWRDFYPQSSFYAIEELIREQQKTGKP